MALGVRVVQFVQVPAAVGGELADGVRTGRHQLPQALGRGHPAGIAAGHPHDRDRLVVDRRPVHGDRTGHRGGSAEFARQVVGHRPSGRVVEDQRGRQPQPGHRDQPVAQLDRAQGVEAQLLEGPVRLDRRGRGVPQHRRHFLTDHLQHHLAAPGLVHPRHPLRQRRSARAHRPPHRAPHQAAQQRRQPLAPRPQRRRVHPQRHQCRRIRGQAGVEGGQAFLHRQRRQALPAHPLPIGLAQPAAQPGIGIPQPVRQRRRHQPRSPPMRRQRVQEHVRRRVTALPGRQHQPTGRGEHHERRQIQLSSQLMQMPGRIRLRTQHPVQPLRAQRTDQPVVGHPGRVHHTLERILRRNSRDQLGQRVTITDVAGRDLDRRAQLPQFRHQVGDARGLLAAPAGQQQVLDLVGGGQVFGDQRAQTTGASGDQHRGLRPELQPSLFLRGRTHQPRHPHRTGPHRRLRLPRGHHRLQSPPRLLTPIHIHQHEPARILRLRRPHQTPHPGHTEIHTLGLGHRHRTPRHHHQPRRGEPLLSQPPLHHTQHIGRRLTHRPQNLDHRRDDRVHHRLRHDHTLDRPHRSQLDQPRTLTRPGHHLTGRKRRPADAQQRVGAVARGELVR